MQDYYNDQIKPLNDKLKRDLRRKAPVIYQYAFENDWEQFSFEASMLLHDLQVAKNNLKKAQSELNDMYLNHDCKKSEDSGCVCDDWFELAQEMKHGLR